MLAWWTADPRLPEALDMDYVMLYRRRACLNIWSTLSKLRNLQGDQIHQLTDSERAIITLLRSDHLI